MWFWNQENFEGLRQVAEEVARDPRLADFAAYCSKREAGLRREALAALSRFLTSAARWEVAEQRAFADRVCEIHATDTIHQLVAQPLRVWLTEVMRAWASATNEGKPLRWLGLLTRDQGAYREALSRDPGDDYARRKIVESITGALDFAAHHVPDYFIGDPRQVLGEAAEADGLIHGFRDAEVKARVEDELRKSRQKVTDWIEYQASGATVDFDDWCRAARGYSWRRPVVVTYDP